MVRKQTLPLPHTPISSHYTSYTLNIYHEGLQYLFFTVNHTLKGSMLSHIEKIRSYFYRHEAYLPLSIHILTAYPTQDNA